MPSGLRGAGLRGPIECAPNECAPVLAALPRRAMSFVGEGALSWLMGLVLLAMGESAWRPLPPWRPGVGLDGFLRSRPDPCPECARSRSDRRSDEARTGPSPGEVDWPLRERAELAEVRKLGRVAPAEASPARCGGVGMGGCASAAPASVSARLSTLLSVPTDADRRRSRASAKPGRCEKPGSWLLVVAVPAETGGDEPEPDRDVEALEAPVWMGGSVLGCMRAGAPGTPAVCANEGRRRGSNAPGPRMPDETVESILEPAASSGEEEYALDTGGVSTCRRRLEAMSSGARPPSTPADLGSGAALGRRPDGERNAKGMEASTPGGTTSCAGRRGPAVAWGVAAGWCMDPGCCADESGWGFC
jgi:hypothetical protein